MLHGRSKHAEFCRCRLSGAGPLRRGPSRRHRVRHRRTSRFRPRSWRRCAPCRPASMRCPTRRGRAPTTRSRSRSRPCRITWCTARPISPRSDPASSASSSGETAGVPATARARASICCRSPRTAIWRSRPVTSKTVQARRPRRRPRKRMDRPGCGRPPRPPDRSPRASTGRSRRTAAPTVPLKGKIDTTEVAVSGWSCGGLQALTIATTDPRVRAVIIHNSGIFFAPTGMKEMEYRQGHAGQAAHAGPLRPGRCQRSRL